MTRLQLSLLSALTFTACDTGSAASAASSGHAQGDPAPAARASAEVEPSGPATSSDGTPLGQVRATGAVDLNAIVNKSPDEVEAALGNHSESGSDRISCVRFTPERVFFACKQEIRVYEHPSFEKLRVEFEDGHAARVAVIGVPGSGAFEPKAALATLGVTVPGEPRYNTETITSPDGSGGGKAEIWDWGNSTARLILAGHQQRVRVSIVDGEWSRSKVELINNHPLNADQKARIKPVRGQEAPTSSTPEAAPSP